jgi:hypothetical protein
MSPAERQLRFNFVKYLILTFKHTDTFIDPNYQYDKFLQYMEVQNNFKKS